MTHDLTTIAKGEGSGVSDARRSVVRSAAEWASLWALHAGPDSAAPPVDFSSHMVAAAFAGERPSPGYAIEIAGAALDGAVLVLTIHELPPPPGMLAAQVVVSPFHMVRLPRHDGEVRFVDAAGAPHRPAATRARSAVAPQPFSANAPSSTGLDPNLAAALSYLAGPFSGVLILLVERANGYVRFHAWQSILGLGGLGLLSAAALVLSFLTLLISPFIFTVMYRFSELVAIACLLAWIICLVKAFTGERWEMPVAGRAAARHATRHPAS